MFARVGTLVALHAAAGDAFYLPGVAPHSFQRGEKVELKVNKLTSSRTQVPYEYYSLPFCTPDEGVVTSAENLGEFLSGDRIDNSPYKLFMRDDTTCNILCQRILKTNDAEAFKGAIEEDYHHNWIVDNLPAAGISKAGESGALQTAYVKGFPVGYITEDANIMGYTPGSYGSKPKHYIYNHMEIIIQYHQVKDGFEGADSNRIVGFLVQPRSVKHLFANGESWSGKDGDYRPYLTTCEKYAEDPLEAAAEWNAMDSASSEEASGEEDYGYEYYYWDDWSAWDGSSSGSTVGSDKQAAFVEPQPAEPGRVLFTYDITWKPSKVHWASRWDIYLSMDGAVSNKVHWFSIFNSIVIVVLLTGLVGMILMRSVHGDISRYNLRSDDVKPLTDEERAIDKEESGWKLVHGNVFTPPAYPLAFCVFVGTGLQLFHMALATAVFAALGFLSPANRGSMMLGAMFLYCLFAAGGGYNAARWHRAFRGEGWKAPGLLVAFGFPGLVFAFFIGFNSCLSSLQSSGAVPFLTLVAIVFVWFGVSAPLAVLGSYLGIKREPQLDFPLGTDQIPRPIPEQPWYLSDGFSIIIGGILPFGACFVELFFMLNSIWMDQYYYVFGFTLIVAVILIVTCAEITMVLIYFQLCNEDYNWWWRSFLASGSTALYMFLYSCLYFTRLEANLAITYFLYFGYMALACFGLFLVTGTIGFAAAFWFVRTIYSSIKVD